MMLLTMSNLLERERIQKGANIHVSVLIALQTLIRDNSKEHPVS